MAFKLKIRITFVGLFTFTQRGNKTYVLAPATNGGGMPEHTAQLYLGYIPLPPPDPMPTPPESVSLDRCILSIEHRMPSPPPNVPFPDQYDIKRVTKHQVSHKLLPPHNRPPADRVTSRIDLGIGGQAKGYGDVGQYMMRLDPNVPEPNERPITMSSYAQWEETLRDIDDITMRVVPMDGGQEYEVSLPSPDAEGTIHLTICHVDPNDLPANVAGVTPGTPIHHWHAYYNLFDDVDEHRIPVYIDTIHNRGLQPNTCPDNGS